MKEEPKKYEVLANHKEERGRYIPFPLQSGTFRDASYMRHTLPELIWLALLIETTGLSYSAKVIESISAILKKHLSESPWFAWSSVFATLSREEQMIVSKEIQNSGYADGIKRALNPFVSWYPKFPLSFVLSLTASGQPDDFSSFKVLLNSLCDKTSKESVWMQGLCLYTGMLDGKVLFAEDSVIAQFEEIKNYPNSEAARDVGGVVRATITSFLHEYIIKPGQTKWSSYFWQRGLELEEIDYSLVREQQCELT